MSPDTERPNGNGNGAGAGLWRRVEVASKRTLAVKALLGVVLFVLAGVAGGAVATTRYVDKIATDAEVDGAVSAGIAAHAKDPHEKPAPEVATRLADHETRLRVLEDRWTRIDKTLDRIAEKLGVAP